MIHKKINTSKETPVTFKQTKKTGLVSDVIKPKTLVVKSKNLKYSYMIFALQKIREKYGIDYDTIIILNYLNELDIFKLRINVESRRISLGDYIDFGLIQKDSRIKYQDFYRLTKKSKDIIQEFNELINDTDKYISKNREAEIDLDSKVSKVLQKHFNKH